MIRRNGRSLVSFKIRHMLLVWAVISIGLFVWFGTALRYFPNSSLRNGRGWSVVGPEAGENWRYCSGIVICGEMDLVIVYHRVFERPNIGEEGDGVFSKYRGHYTYRLFEPNTRVVLYDSTGTYFARLPRAKVSGLALPIIQKGLGHKEQESLLQSLVDEVQERGVKVTEL